jgi:hypothetical protein
MATEFFGHSLERNGAQALESFRLAPVPHPDANLTLEVTNGVLAELAERLSSEAIDLEPKFPKRLFHRSLVQRTGVSKMNLGGLLEDIEFRGLERRQIANPFP